MNQIFPKNAKPRPISLLEAAKLIETGETPFVLFPTDGECSFYERRGLEEFLEGCIICIEE